MNDMPYRGRTIRVYECAHCSGYHVEYRLSDGGKPFKLCEVADVGEVLVCFPTREAAEATARAMADADIEDAK